VQIIYIKSARGCSAVGDTDKKKILKKNFNNSFVILPGSFILIRSYVRLSGTFLLLKVII